MQPYQNKQQNRTFFLLLIIYCAIIIGMPLEFPLPFVIDDLLQSPSIFLQAIRQEYASFFSDSAAFLITLLVSTVIVQFFQMRKKNRDMIDLFEHFDAKTELYQLDIAPPPITPIIAVKPFSFWTYVGSVAALFGLPLFLRFSTWSTSFYHDPPNPRLDLIGNILLLLSFVMICLLVRMTAGARKSYTADDMGLEYRRNQRTRRIAWRDVTHIMYIPVGEQNQPQLAENYAIITADDAITLEIPPQRKQSCSKYERQLQTYGQSLRELVVFASQQTGVPIRVSKKMLEKRDKVIESNAKNAKIRPIVLWILGTLFIAWGIYLAIVNHITHFHTISGIVAHADIYSAKGHLYLVGDDTAYDFSTATGGDDAFVPPLPAPIFLGTQVTLWIDDNQTTAPSFDAIQFNHQGVIYADDYYINPTAHFRNDLIGFIGITAGGVLMIIGGCWSFMRQRERVAVAEETLDSAHES